MTLNFTLRGGKKKKDSDILANLFGLKKGHNTRSRYNVYTINVWQNSTYLF